MRTPSKTALGHQYRYRDLMSTIAEIGDELLPPLGAAFNTVVAEGETTPDVALLRDLLIRLLDLQVDSMVSSEEALIARQASAIDPRLRRDRAAANVRDRLVRLRQAADTYFGPRGVELVTITKNTASNPEGLWRQAKQTLDRLADPAVPTPPPIVDGGPTDLSVFALDLEQATADLLTALNETNRARKRISLQTDAKSRAFDSIDRITVGVGRIVEGLCLLADRRDLADRTRAAIRIPSRRGNVAAPEEVTEPVDPPAEPTEDPREPGDPTVMLV
ncbi:MAG: hypothetical protein AAGD38_06375 [Acidobacteriota bacterium]